MRTITLYRVLAVLLVLMAAALVATHPTLDALALPPWARMSAGVAAGFGTGAVTAVMGVAGGELLIPMIVMFLGEDITTAGSLSLLIS
ncbi:hypothetical protein [Streptomyces sp. NPDC003635]